MPTEAQLRTLIVDDEALAAERLRIVARAVTGVVIVGSVEDGAAALDFIARERPDLVLLDIAMPELNGLELAGLLSRLADPPAIVFCTAFDEHALMAFEVAAVDYLLKPVTPDLLERAVSRVRQRKAAPPQAVPGWLEEIWVPYRSEMIRIGLEQVDWIEAERDYVRLHLADRSYLVAQTLSGLERRLDPDRFVRLHRSAIVRVSAVRKLSHAGLGVWNATLAHGGEVRISRSCMPAARRMLGARS